MKSKIKFKKAQLRSYVEVEVAVLGSLSVILVIVRTVSVDVKQH